MATFTAAKTPRSFACKPSKTLPQLAGSEGKALNQKMTEVSVSIQSPESIKRLIQSLKNSHKEQQEKLECYINSLRSEADSTHESEFTILVLDYSWRVWQELSRHFYDRDLCLEIPDACPGQNNNFMYTWSKAEHYLECEIFGNGEVEFFYRNRKNGEVWGEDTTLEFRFSTAILEKAAIFAW